MAVQHALCQTWLKTFFLSLFFFYRSHLILMSTGILWLGHGFFIFCFTDFFLQQVRVGGQNKNKNKIHWDHFPIELKTFRVSFYFNSI